MTPLPPQWASGPQSTHVDDGNGLRWATLQITETITWALPNRPDQIYDMNQIDAKIHETHRFHYVGRAKWTLKIIDFHTFSQSLKPLENIENQNCLFFIRISTVLSSGAPPMHMFFPLKCSKKSVENAPVKTYEIQKTYLKLMT